MPEQGPTEEEITAFLAGSDISLNMKRGFVRAALARIEPLTRARHVRKVVEGLSEESLVRVHLAGQNGAARGHGVATETFRAALLNELTKEPPHA